MMAGAGVEIERRFLVAQLPDGLGLGERIVQCYPAREEVLLEQDCLTLTDGTLLVDGLDVSECRALAALLSSDENVTPRLRNTKGAGWVTVKGADHGGIRAEYEWEVPEERVAELVKSARWPSIRKRRAELAAGGGLVWEVDLFEGENAGLIIAEVELESLADPLELPDWLGEEVTGDVGWSNACLAVEPRPQSE